MCGTKGPLSQLSKQENSFSLSLTHKQHTKEIIFYFEKNVRLNKFNWNATQLDNNKRLTELLRPSFEAVNFVLFSKIA